MQPMIKYDREARAAYIRLRKGRVARTVEAAPDLILDVDEPGRVLGIELLNVSAPALDPGMEPSPPPRGDR